jgi:hypothetical protein
MFQQTLHQQKQLEVIKNIENSLKNNQSSFSVVEPVSDFVNDPRMALTSVHFPKKDFLRKIRQKILNPLQVIGDNQFFYPDESIHMTIKNIKTISDPPVFDNQDIEKVKKVFDEVIPKHKTFKAYYYRLLLFPYNLALMGTTDPELDEIILELDKKLNEAGVPDDKTYLNDKYFFSNVTLVRFNNPISGEFKNIVQEISNNLEPFSYEIDSVNLLSCNAVMDKANKIKTWNLS